MLTIATLWALSFACALYDMECEVWQVGASYDSKPYRRLMIEAFGAKVYRSPSDVTEVGRALGADPKNHSGSLGIAISEAVADDEHAQLNERPIHPDFDPVRRGCCNTVFSEGPA